MLLEEHGFWLFLHGQLFTTEGSEDNSSAHMRLRQAVVDSNWDWGASVVDHFRVPLVLKVQPRC